MAAKSAVSCTDAEQSIAQPVERAAITSLWSPKIESPCAASERAAMWKTHGVNSPAILNIFGIISSNPCDAVNVVLSAPVWSAPWMVPAAPPSLCNSMIEGTVPQRFFTLREAHSSAHSPIGEDGVIG